MVLALTLAEIFPDQKDALIARAKLIGDDRELAGEHFPSDVEAGRTLAKAIFEKMSENPDFKTELEQVQEECLAHEKKN
jgi:acid phosphatase (class A)